MLIHNFSPATSDAHGPGESAAMDDDEEHEIIRGDGTEIFSDWTGLGPAGPPPSMNGQLTLALLEDLGAVLQRHGYPPLRGYALAELTATLYRLARMHD